MSVIIAVYNAEKYLKECLDSLINQTLKDIEIICVNDGSTDNSLKILEDYARKDERIIVISQANSGGPGEPRNKGLNIARGEFINITDSDDYKALDCLEKLYNATQKFNTDSSFGDCYFIPEKILKFRKTFIDSRPYNKVLDASTSFYNSIYQWQSIFKRTKIQNIKYIGNTDYEDSAFVSEVLMNIDNIVHVKDAICYYRLRRNSSCSGKTKRIFNITSVLDKMEQNLDDYKNNPKIKHLKWHYKNTVKFLLKKAFFKRMPIDFPYLHIFILYRNFLRHMNILQKIVYLTLIITYGTFKYLLLKPLFIMLKKFKL